MEDKPLILWEEVKKQDFEEMDVPLNLSLSLGNSLSSSSTLTDTSVTPLWEKEIESTMNFIDKIGNGAFLSGPSEFGVRDVMFMEKSGFLLSEGTKTEDVSLELSLSLDRNLKNGNSSLKKRRVMGNPKLAANKNKRRKVEEEELRMTELRLGRDPWCIKKKLFVSDVGNMARLMLETESVESHILPHLNADQAARVKEGVPVIVWDCDTNTQHGLVFKQWNKGANVFIGNWTKEFVKRRGLKHRDEIGLYWDADNSRFKFSLLNRAPLL
ncbi:hypothetical protein V6N13_046504 [Hibiscus sabdariffa]|uniref:TF-B3 domain-containing protein n=1 Tax=Hibiscus sabdariffa TaxID=183260 RepID=A0ABR2NZ59_9ROSI